MSSKKLRTEKQPRQINDNCQTANLRLPLHILSLLMRKCHVKLTRCDAPFTKKNGIIIKHEVEVKQENVDKKIDDDHWNSDLHHDICNVPSIKELANTKVEAGEWKPPIGSPLKCFIKPCVVKLFKLDCNDLKLKLEQKFVPVKSESQPKSIINLESMLKPCKVILFRHDYISSAQSELQKRSRKQAKHEIKRRSLPSRISKRIEPPFCRAMKQVVVRPRRKSEFPMKRDLNSPCQRTLNKSSCEKKAHPCFLCGKFISSTTGMEVHLRRHLGEKPFKCKHCSKAFVTSVELGTHIRMHAGERAFKCDICRRSFIYASGLSSHRQKHM